MDGWKLPRSGPPVSSIIQWGTAAYDITPSRGVRCDPSRAKRQKTNAETLSA